MVLNTRTICLICLVGVLAVVGTEAEGTRKEKVDTRPSYQNYNFNSYQVAPMADYGDDDYPDRPPDYEDDPHLESSMCNYTQADFCRSNGFTNLTEMNEAGSCEDRSLLIGKDNYTHSCTLNKPGAQNVNYCCCQFFKQAEHVNFTLLMCCKKEASGRGVYGCNNLWNTVDQINEYDDGYLGGGTNLVVHLLTLLFCLLLTTSWSSEHR